ncbi:hypothetical protein B0H19DRAFT_1067828 [Mycena capillaripes]|nr:hypothetical protein B0H19DRAFT_1067828 [Mycena capillaripes]
MGPSPRTTKPPTIHVSVRAENTSPQFRLGFPATKPLTDSSPKPAADPARKRFQKSGKAPQPANGFGDMGRIYAEPGSVRVEPKKPMTQNGRSLGSGRPRLGIWRSLEAQAVGKSVTRQYTPYTCVALYTSFLLGLTRKNVMADRNQRAMGRDMRFILNHEIFSACRALVTDILPRGVGF